MGLQLVLASASPRRRRLLAEHGYQVEVRPADIEESTAAWLTARELVLLNAVRKCLAVAVKRPGEVTLGVDTLVALDGAALGKPLDLDHAREMLARLSGREHQVFSGVCLIGENLRVTFVEETRVTFRPLERTDIEAYLALIDPLDKAGSYAAQEHHEMIIARTEGSWSNILGLPMERLSRVLVEEFGIRSMAAGSDRAQVVPLRQGSDAGEKRFGNLAQIPHPK